MDTSDDIDLQDLVFWPARAVAALRGAWITTARQVLGSAVTQAGVSALAEQTLLPVAQLAILLEKTRQELSKRGISFNESPVNTEGFGLGAIKPEDWDNDNP